MLELEVEFVDDAVGADGAGDEAHVCGGWCVFEEEVFVEAVEVWAAVGAG